jgi:hypothetical protein
MVFCTLKMCIFALISESQLMVRIRQIKKEKNPFLPCKKCQCFCKSGIPSNYKATSVIIE